MFFKLSEENERISWTKHSKVKMKQYQLSERRVLKVLRKPERKEEGIAPGTVAQMQVSGTKKHPTELWMMYVLLKKPPKESPKAEQARYGAGKFPTWQAKGIKIISAWRYPGRTPIGQRPIIPEDVLEELEKMIKPR